MEQRTEGRDERRFKARCRRCPVGLPTPVKIWPEEWLRGWLRGWLDVTLLVTDLIGMVFMTWLQSRVAHINAAALVYRAVVIRMDVGYRGGAARRADRRDRTGRIRSHRPAEAGRGIDGQLIVVR